MLVPRAEGAAPAALRCSSAPHGEPGCSLLLTELAEPNLPFIVFITLLTLTGSLVPAVCNPQCVGKALIFPICPVGKAKQWCSCPLSQPQLPDPAARFSCASKPCVSSLRKKYIPIIVETHSLKQIHVTAVAKFKEFLPPHPSAY